MKLRLPISLLIVACSSFVFASSRSQRARGAALFEAGGCQHCHTIHNVGGHKGPDLSDVGRRIPKSALRQQIVHGSKVMPAFGDVLAPGEIEDLIAYLHSCREKSAKSAAASGMAANRFD
jgi:ubiquinol-cytochrome c reductase cytochrome b subunit